jgi:WD40 repeat protein
MGTAISGSSRFPIRLRRVTRFAVLWWGCFVGIMMMAGVEAVVLWQRGIRYKPTSSFSRVWASNVSLDANGISAAAIVTFKQNSKEEGSWRDVVLLGLRQGSAELLGVRSLQPQDVAISPGGNAVAIVCVDGSIHAVSDLLHVTAGTAMPRPRLFARSEDPNVARLVFSPDGRLLAAIGECSVTVWQWPDGTRLSRRRHSSKSLRVLVFSEDSEKIVSPGQERELCIWDVNSGKLIEANAMTEDARFAVLSPDTRLVASVVAQGHRIVVRPLGGGDPLWQATWAFPAIAFDHQGRRVASVVTQRGRIGIAIRDALTGRQLSILYGHDDVVAGLAFCSDGRLYSWDCGGHIRSWNVEEQREQGSLSLLQWAAGDRSAARKIGLTWDVVSN